MSKNLIENLFDLASNREALDKAKSKILKEQENYKRYNKDFLSNLKSKADLVNKLKSELSPFFDKILEIFVDYLFVDETKDVDEIYFYKEPEIHNKNVLSDSQFKLFEESLNEINKTYNIDLEFFTGIKLENNLIYQNINIEDYDEVDYTISDTVYTDFLLVNNCDCDNVELIISGEFPNKLKIYTKKNITSDYIESLLSAIFIDSDIHIVNPVEKIN